ncbi:Mss4-like protein [Cantharellus anzutake]|uniref:Mss4-like protein n=1 Tax=Cantharellus anzutake TaxID=1750568 RepID=UPI0019082D27|nr:Mss4-like protein [Cantharellus anzutake]KAF8327928.1 Mss4-like protein [Cantharellus anzutake]
MASRIPHSTLHGGCFCKRVRYSIDVDIPPLLNAYCHCTRCQKLFGAPFIHTIHLRPEAFKWTTAPIPLSNVTDEYVVINVKHRFRCKTCGSHIASWNEAKQKWSVWGATLDRDVNGRIIDWSFVKPTDHMFYGTRMLDIPDNLGKWEGYPNQSEPVHAPLTEDA